MRDVDWLKVGDWHIRDKPFAMKTLTEISKYPAFVKTIRQRLGLDDEHDEEEEIEVLEAPAYSIEEARKELFLPPDQLDRAISLLKRKKNLILKGPPGVGKTFIASRLGHLLSGSKSREFTELVQFHQSYAYEDFVQGFRPRKGGGFRRQEGPFLRFCGKALQDLDTPYTLIIDEINRGNLSKILGELMMLIEADKREERWATTLAYATVDDEPFHVPPNLHIIGTMNTADRSLALVDYALRRRFAFVTVDPAFESGGFDDLLAENGVEASLRDTIRDRVADLNNRIRVDPNLGPGFVIGHSYFCHVPPDAPPDDTWYADVIESEIAPLLEEYWFDAPERAGEALAALRDDPV